MSLRSPDVAPLVSFRREVLTQQPVSSRYDEFAEDKFRFRDFFFEARYLWHGAPTHLMATVGSTRVSCILRGYGRKVTLAGISAPSHL